jgi:hypothetical protein
MVPKITPVFPVIWSFQIRSGLSSLRFGLNFPSTRSFPFVPTDEVIDPVPHELGWHHQNQCGILLTVNQSFPLDRSVVFRAHRAIRPPGLEGNGLIRIYDRTSCRFVVLPFPLEYRNLDKSSALLGPYISFQGDKYFVHDRSFVAGRP